ncbi:MauE/DoxX family redox-associated membrane protein [Micromonospora sp. CPCC 205539]|uniref:MauE/DoxX family redox-associated membrane protein n=1 Tax=Micromonospora sp. CPCC 205539 TaxID=3122408 RepID=UPI002FEEDEDD
MANVLLMCRVLLLLVFLAAVVGKGRPTAFAQFARSMREYDWIPKRLHTPVAYVVVLGEGAIVLLLLLPRWTWLGLALAMAMTSAFTAATAVSLVQGRHRTCQCFGMSGTMPQGAPHLVRDLLLIVVAGVGVAGWINAAPGGSFSHPGAVAAIAVAVIGGLAVVRMEDLIFLTTRVPRVHQGIGGRS